MEKPQGYEILVVRSDGRVLAHSKIACATAEELKRAVESSAREAESNF
jgi:hypothetical protein